MHIYKKLKHIKELFYFALCNFKNQWVINSLFFSYPFVFFL